METKNQIKIFLGLAILIAMYWGGNILNQRAIAYTNNQNQIQYIQQLEQKNKQLDSKLQELQKKIEEIKIEELKAEVR
jgi:uncharacterized protein YlxW (UPF0749 family)